MKINTNASVVNWVTSIKEKHEDAGHGAGGGSDSHHGAKEDHRHEPQEPAVQVEASEDAVVAAIERFRADETTQASGLLAEKDGSGPGLRVVLKDVNGSVVRQFSGDEFLKLRETSSQDGRGRGRLLDRKY